MYEYKDNDIVSLDLNFRDMAPSSEDITQDELRLVTSDASKDLSTDELNGLRKKFKKINYTILDMEKNGKGFGLTEGGMKVFVDHFDATKLNYNLHNFFKDHDYGHIDSMLGRIIDTNYDKKNKRVRRTALIDLRHPTAQRLDMFQNLSTTLLHGKPVCSVNGEDWNSCNHKEAFPRSTVAYGMEDSLVTQSAYANAKRDSLSLFEDSLSNIDISKEFFKGYITDIDKLNAEDIVDKDKVAAEGKITDKDVVAPSAVTDKDIVAPESEIIDKDKLIAEGIQAEKDKKDMSEIKENINLLKELIESDILN